MVVQYPYHQMEVELRLGLGNDGNGSGAGHVRIFENIGGSWTQIGQDVMGNQLVTKWYSVSLSSDGSRVAIGAI